MKDFLRCLILPLTKITLLVPYATIAEIIHFEQPKPFNKTAPLWALGNIEWRGIQVPIICLEKIADASFSPEKQVNPHIIIVNRMFESKKMDFIGIVIQGIPIMRRFKSADLEFKASSTEPHLIMEVAARNQLVSIPNIKWIEEKVEAYLIK